MLFDFVADTVPEGRATDLPVAKLVLLDSLPSVWELYRGC